MAVSDNTGKRLHTAKREGPFRFHIYKDSEENWTAKGALKTLLEEYTQEQIEAMAIFSDGHYILEFTAGLDQNGDLVYVKTALPPASTN